MNIIASIHAKYVVQYLTCQKHENHCDHHFFANISCYNYAHCAVSFVTCYKFKALMLQTDWFEQTLYTRPQKQSY